MNDFLVGTIVVLVIAAIIAGVITLVVDTVKRKAAKRRHAERMEIQFEKARERRRANPSSKRSTWHPNPSKQSVRTSRGTDYGSSSGVDTTSAIIASSSYDSGYGYGSDTSSDSSPSWSGGGGSFDSGSSDSGSFSSSSFD